MGAILLGIESITHCLARCRIYERLYLNPQIRQHVLDEARILQSSLTQLYANILVYLAYANRTFTENTIGRPPRALLNPLVIILTFNCSLLGSTYCLQHFQVPEIHRSIE